MHLTSGELVRLLTHDSYWDHFAKYFLASKSVVTLKLQEIGNIRNSLAHFRPLKPDDVEVVKQNANQVLGEVEKHLVAMMKCDTMVPSNTEDEWYLALSTLGTEKIRFVFSQSEDRYWIRITMRFFGSIVSEIPKQGATSYSYRVLNLRPLDLLQQYDTIRKQIIFLAEYVPYTSMPNNLQPVFEKRLRFLISKKRLDATHKELRESFDGVLKQILYETQVISEDQLARGKILNTCSVVARLNESGNSNYWSINNSVLETAVEGNIPPEYWGNFSNSNSDFVSDTEVYPWMPIRVCEESLPF